MTRPLAGILIIMFVLLLLGKGKGKKQADDAADQEEIVHTPIVQATEFDPQFLSAKARLSWPVSLLV